MPAAQVIDLSPIPRKETTLEKTVGSFVDKYRQNQIEENDYNALESIYKRHQHDGDNLQNMLQDVIADPRISPTKRVNAVKSLTEAAKFNAQLQKTTQAQQAAEQKKAANAGQVRQIEKAVGLEEGALAAYDDNPALAYKMSQPKKEANAVGGLGGTPLTPEESQKIKDVLEKNPQANAEGLEVAFGEAGIAPGRTKDIVESRRRQEEAEAKNKPGTEYSKLREKAVSDYVTKSLQGREDAEELQFTLDSARKALEGEIEGPGIKALIKNDPYGQLFVGLTPDEASLQASNKKLLEGSKGIFGSKPTEREIFLLLNSMLPAIGKSKEANQASLYFIDKLTKLKIMHGDLVDEISKNGYVPDIESQVNQRMKPMIDEFRKELNEGVKALESEKKPTDKIKVKAPNGKIGYMTQDQINAAKEKNELFTPVQ